MKICNICKAENPDRYMYCHQCGTMATGNEETVPDRPTELSPTDPSKVSVTATLATSEVAIMLLKEIAKETASIRRWITFFGVLVVLGILFNLRSSCT